VPGGSGPKKSHAQMELNFSGMPIVASQFVSAIRMAWWCGVKLSKRRRTNMLKAQVKLGNVYWPAGGICFFCQTDILSLESAQTQCRKKQMITGCPSCNRSFVD